MDSGHGIPRLRRPGDTFAGRGPHEGHTITVVATDMPSVREYGDKISVNGYFDTWVECSCGEAWKYAQDEHDA